ncbi:MAG TPA: LptE family protein [Candidatus Eisenbacteria bacterium]|nr:LptE family protein [Candidatus Eisenbacteria bacterium]
MWGRSLAAAIAAAAIVGSGCAYTATGVLPSHLKTLAIPVFGNNTVEFRLADDVTEAITNAFIADRRLRIGRERDADAVLRGTVLLYRNQVYGFTTEERATQYEILLVVQVSFRDQVKNRVIWKEDQLSVRTTYNVVAVGDTPALTESDGRAAVVQKLAEQIVSRTVQGW